ncbi:transmembrane protein 268-like isoform X2 [Pleurodeles waltl]
MDTGSACWDPRFEYDQCREMLAQHGFQVPPEDLELPLRRALDSPEVRRFLFFSSTLFLTLLAPVLYLVIWCSLYSSFHLLGTPFLQNYFAAFCVMLSAVTVVVTGAIVLVLNHYHGKISVNTEVRLTQANELLRRHHLLVGLSDRMKNCTCQLFLTFCYFDASECLTQLTHLLDRKHESNRGLQRRMKRKFGRLCVVVIGDSGCPRPHGSRDECVDSEETPLLEAERDVEPGRPLSATTSSLACCLAPGGPPQAVASQLVSLHSALYVKLLVTRRLPRTSFSLHAKEAGVPCLCQFIESALTSICTL